TYAHVPAGSTVDLAETITGIFERFAPGFRDMVVGVRSVPAADQVGVVGGQFGGDIGVGGNNMVSALTGPTVRWNPWSTPVPRAYLCSSATPPG
ncbi:dehydrogenase, partial [Mycobacterium sp. ITM-2017-0098]